MSETHDGGDLAEPTEPGSDERMSDAASESLGEAPETVPAVPEGEDDRDDADEDESAGERRERGSEGDEGEPQPA